MEQDLFLAMGGIAWAFDIRKKRDMNGGEVDVHWDDFNPLLIAKPAPFEFDLEIRGQAVQSKLVQMWESGKGEDDINLERQQALGERMAADRATESASQTKDDDILSVGGSDTSGPSEGGSESSSSQSVHNVEELDIWV